MSANNPATTPPKLRAHYVLSTHWDREWYQSFQNFRYQLVQLLDRVFAGLEDGRLRGPFQTDGQAIILEDYLEIRPERRAQVQRLAQAGKLVIGPWYVLPDEFLVSGEALIRNLRLGRQLARSFGVEPSNVGFVCDLFGHNSQMPQIFAGFGIHGGLIWRGLNHLQTRHVRWRGADGTELVAYRFPGGGYCDYTFKVRHAREHQLQPTTATVGTDLDAYLRYEAEHTEVDPILLFDGGDHEEWDQTVYAAMLHHAERADDDFEIVHTSLDAYLAEVLPQAGRISTTVAGELREPGLGYDDEQWVIPGVLSSRVWIKQANADVPDPALPVGGAFQRLGAPGPGRRGAAGLPGCRMAMAAAKPSPRLHLRLQHRCGARGYEIPFQPGAPDRRSADAGSHAADWRQRRWGADRWRAAGRRLQPAAPAFARVGRVDAADSGRMAAVQRVLRLRAQARVPHLRCPGP